jgi:hypothetical protein
MDFSLLKMLTLTGEDMRDVFTDSCGVTLQMTAADDIDVMILGQLFEKGEQRFGIVPEPVNGCGTPETRRFEREKLEAQKLGEADEVAAVVSREAGPFFDFFRESIPGCQAFLTIVDGSDAHMRSACGSLGHEGKPQGLISF